jgi:hypothetical protein
MAGPEARQEGRALLIEKDIEEVLMLDTPSPSF